jgi:hypothetical protein
MVPCFQTEFLFYLFSIICDNLGTLTCQTAVASLKCDSFTVKWERVHGVRAQDAEKNIGPKGCEDTRKWRKVHSEKLRNLCTASNIVRMIISGRLDGWGAGEMSYYICVCACARVCVCVKLLIGNYEGKRRIVVLKCPI